MKLTWLGHAGFRIEIGGKVLLLDPWLTGNPMFDEARRGEACAAATHILLTHGHGDHAGDALTIARDLNVPVVGIYDLVSWWQESEAVKTIGINKGGTIDLGGVTVTMVNAVHSSSVRSANGPVCAGSEAGFMISGEGHTIYASGDTDVMADMGVFQDLHHPDIGILSAGGNFTMDMRRA
ncbi:MAG: metal-dependent hydrolase, partial [Halocynthiibacter sp.]